LIAKVLRYIPCVLGMWLTRRERGQVGGGVKKLTVGTGKFNSRHRSGIGININRKVLGGTEDEYQWWNRRTAIIDTIIGTINRTITIGRKVITHPAITS